MFEHGVDVIHPKAERFQSPYRYKIQLTCSKYENCVAVHCSGNTKDDGVLGRDAGGAELQQDEEEQEPHHRNTRMQCRAPDYITDSSCYSGRSTPPISCIYILLHSSPGPTPVLRYKTPLSRFHIDGEFVRVLVLGLSSCTSHKAIFLDIL